jgi:hypothetical protein
MVTPIPTSTLSMVAFAYTRLSSNQGKKTIFIDFDLKDVPFTKYLETYHIESKKNHQPKKGSSFYQLKKILTYICHRMRSFL